MFKKKVTILDAKVRALEEENRELREASENHGGTEIAEVLEQRPLKRWD